MSRIKLAFDDGSCLQSGGPARRLRRQSAPSRRKPPRPDPGTVIQITGQRRLAWTQPAEASISDLHFAA